MKKFKKASVIILTVLIVIFSITSYLTGVVRLGLLSPGAYAKVMPAFNAYNSLYDGFTDYLLSPLEAMTIPEEIQGVPEDLVATAIPRKEFNKLVGRTIGGGLGWLLYNHDDVDLPLKYFADSLYTTIANDERVTNSSTNIKATMEAIVSQRIEIFVPNDEYEQNFRGYLYYFLSAGDQKLKDWYDYWVDVFFYYYGIRLSIGTIISFALLLLLLTGLFFLTKENRSTFYGLVKRLCFVYAIINVVIALVLLVLPLLAKIIGPMQKYSDYIQFAKGITNSFALIAVFYALILGALAVGAGILKNKEVKSKSVSE
ncbi:MAG: hypothetical protein JXN65_00135 [Clostridia bacterium]|nr:hypothetical protein [Clostridia bacterium]